MLIVYALQVKPNCWNQENIYFFNPGQMCLVLTCMLWWYTCCACFGAIHVASTCFVSNLVLKHFANLTFMECVNSPSEMGNMCKQMCTRMPIQLCNHLGQSLEKKCWKVQLGVCVSSACFWSGVNGKVPHKVVLYTSYNFSFHRVFFHYGFHCTILA